jgi:murein DD-endopeptidase MepM/ murein hydrolase activator NlpD
MINSYGPISTTDILRGTTNPPKSSSTSDIFSSFKEIFALLTAANGTSSGQPMGMNMGDLMAPLMLLLLERLVEEQIERDPSADSAQSSSEPLSEENSLIRSPGSKPVPSGPPVTGRLSQHYHSGHNGLDIAIPVGTPIQTTMDGQVVHAGWNNQGYGNLVIVENGEYRTYYAHLSSIPVSVGETVQAGTTIGLSGNTGNSTGPHLHYEIRRNKVAINPTAATFGTG